MKKILILILFLLGAYSAEAQVALAPFTPAQYFDNSGKPCAGCKIYTYAAGTTTMVATYRNSAGTVLNTNPVVLDSAGRGDIWLTPVAYKLVLQTAAGSLIKTEDGITSSNIALLSLNNTWAGSQVFNGSVTTNGSVTFNAGFSSSGPNTLNGGGTFNGSYGGSPSLTGTPNFIGGLMASTGTFSGQITSTVATGTAPFVIASTTVVPNLNADKLDGCDWATPCVIGSATPNAAFFTTAQVNTSLALNGSTPQTGVQGTDVKLLSSNVVTPVTAQPLCLDALGGATNTGCNAVPQIFKGSNTATTCPTGGSTFDTCTYTITWSGTFTSTSYKATCTGVNANDPRANILGIASKAVGTMVITVVAEGSNPVSYASIDCVGVL